MSLDEILLPSPDCDVNQIGPTALAYIGDVVFELMVRSRHVWPTRRTADLQQQVVAFVRGTYLPCLQIDNNHGPTLNPL
jgi:23S rRNA maturation mini-RNase III